MRPFCMFSILSMRNGIHSTLIVSVVSIVSIVSIHSIHSFYCIYSIQSNAKVKLTVMRSNSIFESRLKEKQRINKVKNLSIDTVPLELSKLVNTQPLRIFGGIQKFFFKKWFLPTVRGEKEEEEVVLDYRMAFSNCPILQQLFNGP